MPRDRLSDRLNILFQNIQFSIWYYMRRFLFEDKEYRYKANFRQARKIRDPVVELARLLRKGSIGKRFNNKSRVRPKDLRQKCIAKMQYSNSIEAHHVQIEKYLIREGAGLDGNIPELFGTDSEEYRKNMVPKNFRIFLSPSTNNYDLKDLGEEFIMKLIFMILRRISKRWTMPIKNWGGAMHQFSVIYGDRVPL